jgi:hypothetical protein
MTRTVGIDLTSENPFLTIWTRPRATIRGIVDRAPTYAVVPITIATGVLQALSILASTGQVGQRLSVWSILAIAAVVGPIGGMLCLYLGAWLVGVSCRAIGGVANLRNVRAALAWSMVPTLGTIPLWLARLAVFGKKAFAAELPSFDEQFWQRILLLLLLAAAELILDIWSLAILLLTLAEVEGLSVWKSLGCLLAIFVVIVIATVIFVVVTLLQ